MVVGELVGDRLRYRTLNSCLTFVSALHGKQLISVEDLRTRPTAQRPAGDGRLPRLAVRLLYPGFVMSLFAPAEERRRGQ